MRSDQMRERKEMGGNGQECTSCKKKRRISVAK